jgi:Arc/MetJ-type ribon-helix-helix transcriptional regulator
MPTLTFKVPLELAKKLEMVSSIRRVPKSKFIREALRAALRKEKGKPSLFEQMEGSLGCFAGKSDLATNPKYLKNFGKWRR